MSVSSNSFSSGFLAFLRRMESQNRANSSGDLPVVWHALFLLTISLQARSKDAEKEASPANEFWTSPVYFW